MYHCKLINTPLLVNTHLLYLRIALFLLFLFIAPHHTRL